jgi:hypothetical protein
MKFALAAHMLHCDMMTVDHRSPPAQVYRDPDVDKWIVEPPHGASVEPRMVFSGSGAQQQALVYAYEKFGSARFFPI